MATSVRRIRAGEGVLLRDVRLRALRDAPGEFSSTFEEESGRDLAAWEEASVARASGSGSATFVAASADGVAGLVGAYRRAEEPSTVELVSMWVDPSARGRGIGTRLVEAVLGWAADAGAERVVLWVTRDNDAASALYKKAGFAVTGEVQASPADPCREDVRMLRRLAIPPAPPPGLPAPAGRRANLPW